MRCRHITLQRQALLAPQKGTSTRSESGQGSCRGVTRPFQEVGTRAAGLPGHRGRRVGGMDGG